MHSMYQQAIDGKIANEKSQIHHLLDQFKSSFSCDENDLGLTNLTEHHIDTGNSHPLRQPPRRVPHALGHEEKTAIEQMLVQGVIVESSSPWASPIVLVKKKNGKIRPCVDYRRLNNVTQKDAYPLPRIQDCLDSFAGATSFSTLDLTSGYHQIPMCKDDAAKTAFVTKYGLFEFKTMPFGLCSAPATFQRVMELALRGLQWTTCLIYLDDVIVFGSSFEQHFNRLQTVLTRLARANLKLKPEKCELFQSSVTFLGHVISKDGIQVDPDNITKVKTWPVPTNVTEVRMFLGFCSYYRRFVQAFSTIAYPLSDLTKKESPLEWTSSCQTAFDTLKNAIISPPIVSHIHDTGPVILDTDACDVGKGAVLSQMQGEHERVIAYGSRTLNSAEQNYCVTDKELLAIKHFVEYFRQYLLGRPFVVRTDHQALIWLFSLKEPKGRIARWIKILSAYDFSIEYRQGKKHLNADGMSRCPNPRDCQCDTNETLSCGPCKKCIRQSETMVSHLISQPIHHVSTRSKCHSQQANEMIIQPWLQGYTANELRTFQQNDSAVGLIRSWKQQGTRPTGSVVCSASPEVRHDWNLWHALEIHDGILFKQFVRHETDESYLQLIVPKEMRTDIMTQMHASPLSGHLGRKRTIQKIRQQFYCYDLRHDVTLKLKRCDICAANKTPPKHPRASMGDMRTGAPMDRLCTDIMGPLPLTPRGNRYVLVVTDSFSKWVEIFPVPDQTASTCASIILNEVIARFSCPYDLHSDQGRNFESTIFRDLCQLLTIRKTRTSPND